MIFLFPELYLLNEFTNACLKRIPGTPTQISVRRSYQVPHKTPVTKGKGKAIPLQARCGPEGG